MGPIKAPTVADKKRYVLLKQLGCLCCRKQGRAVPAEIQHMVSGGKRLGNQFTLPWCSWHHRGVPMINSTATKTENLMGPSYARSKRDFIAEYGCELDQLAEVNQLIETETELPFAQEVFG